MNNSKHRSCKSRLEIILQTIELQASQNSNSISSADPLEEFPLTRCINNTFGDRPTCHIRTLSRALKRKCISRHRFQAIATLWLQPRDGEAYTHLVLAVARHRLYRSPLGRRIALPLSPLSFRDSPLSPRPSRIPRPRTRRSSPLDIHGLKVYIAHRQTCPNCSSSCYANGRICYDSACRGIVLHYRVMLSAWMA